RFPDVIPLRAIDAVLAQQVERARVLHEFRNDALAERAPDLYDRADETLVDGIVQQVADEAAVDLQVVDRELPQVVEGAEARSKVIEGEAAPDLAQGIDHAPGLFVVGDRRGLGDLEGDAL